MLPRTTRAQAMDVLSSQANITGYKAVLLATNSYGRFPNIYDRWKHAPAKMLILGAWSCWFTSHCYRKKINAVVGFSIQDLR